MVSMSDIGVVAEVEEVLVITELEFGVTSPVCFQDSRQDPELLTPKMPDGRAAQVRKFGWDAGRFWR